MAFFPTANLRAVPLPPFTTGGTPPPPLPGFYTMLRINPRAKSTDGVPIPFFTTGGTPPPPLPGFYSYFPIKPLPQGSGGGGPVGTPIDSG